MASLDFKTHQRNMQMTFQDILNFDSKRDLKLTNMGVTPYYEESHEPRLKHGESYFIGFGVNKVMPINRHLVMWSPYTKEKCSVKLDVAQADSWIKNYYRS